jgi:hypothetical protein
MGNTLRNVFALISLAMVYQLASFGLITQGQDKKPVTKTSGEIEKLVTQLGDENFAIRANASRRLAQMPGALAILRPFLKDEAIEIRMRTRILVEELTQRNLKSLLQKIVNQKKLAPLDLLTDLVVEHRERLVEEDWKEIFRTIGATQTYYLKDTKLKPSVPTPSDKFLKYPLLRGELLTRRDPVAGSKIVGRRVTISQLPDSAVFASNSIEGTSLIKCIGFANGGVMLRHGSAILASFVFSDEEVSCETILGSLVIARGRVKAKKIEDSLIIEDSAKLSFFSTQFFGLSVSMKNEVIKITGVVPNSLAEKSGFCIGDVILFDVTELKTLESLEKALRRSLARELELPLRVRRAGREQKLFLSYLLD